MKKIVLMCVLAITGTGLMYGQYPHVSLRDVQFQPIDSLVIADSVQGTAFSRISLQASNYVGDTVTVTARCVIPPKILTFTAGGFTMLLYDTATVNSWGAIFVRVNAPADTAQIIQDGFLSVEAGDIITITGLISEFPTTINQMNSVTQFQPIAGIPIVPVGAGSLPSHVAKTTGDFYRGIFPASGKPVRYSTGEPFESVLVELTDLTVDARVNTARGTFSAVDANGNQITMYDASRYFTLGHGGTLPWGPDSVWQQQYPNVGAKIDTLRGMITTVSGSENPRGYRIAPIYRGDIVFGIVLPSLTEHRRNPIVVHPDSTVRIAVRARQQTGGFPLSSVELLYSINNGPFISVPMAFQSGDTAVAQIPQQPENTFVHYFIKATDNQGNFVHLASSAFGAVGSDTSRGFFFYNVLNRPLTIRDIQQTPYANGRSPYIGATVSVSGVVTADTAHIGIAPLNTGGTNAWYMQDGTQLWSGLWIVGPDTLMHSLRNGDSITVTGTVAEQFDVTRIQNISTFTRHTIGRPQPLPLVKQTGDFGPTIGNGHPGAEPYEAMLVQFNNVTVSSIDPVFSDPTEFEVDDGSGPILVRRDGRHNYSNVPADTVIGRTIIKLGDRISFLRGVMYFSFNRYKITPRANADFGTITSIDIDHRPEIPASYTLTQNFPNPFNPVTTVEYALPVAGAVTLKVYNLLGQEVRTLVNDVQTAGTYTVRFDASDHPSGVYFYRLTAGGMSQVRKMMLLK